MNGKICKFKNALPTCTILKSNRFVFQFMDVPHYLVQSVEFVSEYKIEVSFIETAEFCIEKYFKENFDVLQGKNLSLKYLDECGVIVRTDTYTLKKIGDIKKCSLDYDNDKRVIIKILFDCTNHDISTCKE